ncbi:UDP-N-acetylmuramate--L-alanine ligase [uncultured Gulosibacter sp.]|uniref:UDP-N-acetylmuramate--L-alanine ligase n=1 Tax=uncultured Gulosibacter sp. TaxID=1339167 RepID=UPI0037DD9C07
MVIKPDPQAQIPAQIARAHFIGIGGSGMSGIARMFLDSNVAVSGSDRSESEYTRNLLGAGAQVTIGHAAENLPDGVDVVVVTSALWPDNPELVAARERGITVLHRSQALVWLTQNSRVVAVAGAHGKTTSTGMIATALVELGRDPSFVNGGVVAPLGTNERRGSGAEFIVEADESDGSFLFYDVAIALITNIDNDHLDHYGSVDAFQQAFVDFASGASEAVVLSADDDLTVALRKRLDHPRTVSFGTAENADVRLLATTPLQGRTRMRIAVDGAEYEGELAVPGFHNALNATGAVAVLRELGVDPAAALRGLAAFTGTKRRFELHDTIDGVSVYDDYAHHPREVVAALTAAREVVGDGRILAVHQPHLYSRTQAMSDEFAAAYEALADHTVVLDVDGAREDPVPGVTGELVVRGFEDASKVDYRPDWADAATRVAEWTEPGDFVITFGCGNVNLIIPQLLAALRARTPRASESAAAVINSRSDR